MAEFVPMTLRGKKKLEEEFLMEHLNQEKNFPLSENLQGE